MKHCFCEKMNIIDNPLAKLIEGKKENTDLKYRETGSFTAGAKDTE